MAGRESAVVANEVSGEVTVRLQGVEFVLKATMPNVAALQSALDTPGLRTLNIMLATSDARVIYHGMKCLCVSGNADKLDDMLFPSVIGDAVEAVNTAMVLGMPKESDTSGKLKGEGAQMTASPGAE